MKGVWTDFFKEEMFSGWKCVRCSRICFHFEGARLYPPHLFFLCTLYLRQCSVFTHTGRTAALLSEAHVITESVSTGMIHKVPTDFSTAGPNCWRDVHLHHQGCAGLEGWWFPSHVLNVFSFWLD